MVSAHGQFSQGTYHPQNFIDAMKNIGSFLNCKTTQANMLLVLYSIFFPHKLRRKKNWFPINECRNPTKRGAMF